MTLRELYNKLNNIKPFNRSLKYSKPNKIDEDEVLTGLGETEFPNAKYPSAYGIGLVTGSNDLYTVPVGRKAIVYDYIVTNVSGATITNYPEIKIGSTYYRIGSGMNESTNGYGHNYAMSAGKYSGPIVMNAGEKFSVNCSANGLTVWVNVKEFDASSNLKRADIRNFVVGNNTLLTVAPGKSVVTGQFGMATSNNNPNLNFNGFSYYNNSGGTVIITSINIVPSGGSVAAGNTFSTTNTIVTNQGFSKYFHGNLGSGDSIVIIVDSAASGQFMWMNYIEA